MSRQTETAKRMPSIRTVILITLVTSAALMMLVFGAISLYHEYQNTQKTLRNHLEALSGQIAMSVSQPLWTLNMEGTTKILESFMQNRNLYGIVIRESDQIVLAMTRNESWQVIPSKTDISASDLFYQRSLVKHNGQDIATLDVYMSRRFIREDLKHRLVVEGIYMLLFNVILLSILFFALMKTVIGPLKRIENYALTLSKTDHADRIYMPDIRSTREIAHLKTAIEKMVAQNKARYLELQTSQLATRDAEAKYRGIFENATEGIFQVASDGRPLTVNPAMAQILGYDSPKELLDNFQDTTLEIYSNPAQRDKFVQIIKKHGYVKDFEYLARRKDGSPVTTLIDAHLIRDAEGKPMYFEGIVRDITEKKRMDELSIAKEAAEKTAQSRNEFLANISHEIRTPMNAIIGFTNLAMKQDLTPKLSNYLNTIGRSARNLLHLINDILDFSKIEADRLELESVDFKLNEVIRNISDLILLKAEEKGVQFSVSIDPYVPNDLVGDPHRLNQILLNLANNAVKFTLAGRVMLTVQPIETGVQDCLLMFSVKDTGIGMTPEHLARIFKPFSQGDSSVTRRFGGTGLGLAISKHLVERMGGRIQVESHQNRGSTFSFTIRLLRQPDSARRQGAALSRPTLATDAPSREEALAGIRGASVLLVEDNVINQELTCEILKECGLTVDIAGNGREALSSIKERHYDLILMDVQMPVMSGFEATVAIRQMEHLRAIPIVAMTAHNTARDKEACLQAGMNDYLSKPLDIDLLTAILIRWIPPRTQKMDAAPPHMDHTAAKEISALSLPQALPGIDLQEGLARLQGNTHLYLKLLKSFMQHYEHASRDIDLALQARDYDRVAGVAHAIKGAAGNLSIIGLAASSSQLHVEAKRGGASCDMTPTLNKFSETLAIACASIHRLTETTDEVFNREMAASQDDPAVLTERFRELSGLLQKSDLRAGAAFGLLKAQLIARSLEPEAIRMENLLINLEFSQALDILSDLADKLNIPTGGIH